MDLNKKIEKAIKILEERITEYEDFMNKDIRGKKYEDIDSLSWSLLSGYSSEKELADRILRILKEP